MCQESFKSLTIWINLQEQEILFGGSENEMYFERNSGRGTNHRYMKLRMQQIRNLNSA